MNAIQSMGYPLPAQMGAGMPPQVQPVYVNSTSQLPQGVIPLSQSQVAQLMASGQGPAIAQATLAAQSVNAPTTAAHSILKSVLVGAGIGAAAGGAVGLIPILPPSILTGALIGAGAGALAGLVVGVIRAKRQKRDAQLLAQNAAQMPGGMAGAGQVPGGMSGAREVTPVGTPPAGAMAARHIHLNAAMKAKWSPKKAAPAGVNKTAVSKTATSDTALSKTAAHKTAASHPAARKTAATDSAAAKP